jgi:hypothetical protein
MDEVAGKKPVSAKNKYCCEDGKCNCGNDFVVNVKAHFGNFHPWICHVMQ